MSDPSGALSPVLYEPSALARRFAAHHSDRRAGCQVKDIKGFTLSPFEGTTASVERHADVGGTQSVLHDPGVLFRKDMRATEVWRGR